MKINHNIHQRDVSFAPSSPLVAAATSVGVVRADICDPHQGRALPSGGYGFTALPLGESPPGTTFWTLLV